MRRRSNTKRSTLPANPPGYKSNMRGRGIPEELVGVVNRFFTGQEFPGEHHAISLSGKDKGKMHQYTGPGTNLEARLARGDQGINDLDRAAREHDIAYRDALLSYRNSPDFTTGSRGRRGNTPGRKQFLETVWNADDRFVNKAFNSKDDPITGKVAGSLIKAKKLAEKAGILDTTTFSGAGNYNARSDPLHKLRQSNAARSPPRRYIARSPRRSRSPPVTGRGRSSSVTRGRSPPRRSSNYPDYLDSDIIGYLDHGEEELIDDEGEELIDHLPHRVMTGGIPIGPIISVLSTIGPPLVSWLWDKVHGSKQTGKGRISTRYGSGRELSTEDKREILLHELTSGVTI